VTQRIEYAMVDENAVRRDQVFEQRRIGRFGRLDEFLRG
jgi:hypothetical protein